MEQPQLEKPGAGLPFLESLYVRWYVGPFLSRKSDKEKNLRLFAMIGARILKEFASVPADKRDQKVLVPRMKGVEDSSRNWSANEVLEPLKIEDNGPDHKHPWLGRFNALQWTWLLAGHGGLHLAQLQAIKKLLG